MHQSDRQQRMPAEIKETLAHSDRMFPENRFPNSDQLGFKGILRRGQALRFRRICRASGRGRCPAIHFAVGRERHRLKLHEGRWQHVIREPFLQEFTQIAPGRRGLFRRNKIGDQRLFAASVFAGHDHRHINPVELTEQRLNLAQFHTEAANFHLIVGAPQKFNIAVGQVARHVSGLVQTSALRRGERIVNELGRRQIRPVQISPGHAAAANVKFSANANGLRLQLRIQDVNLRVVDRPSDRKQRGKLGT